MTVFFFEPHALGYSRENAYWLGRLAQLAYAPEAAIGQTVTALGLTRFQFFSGRNTDTQAFVAGNDQVIVVAFRGTEPTRHQDWLTDVRIRLVDGVHRGFKDALAEVWGDIQACIGDFKGRRLSFAEVARGADLGDTPGLWFTGHSLGAALATLAVSRLVAEDQPVDGLYTFGQPRTGSRDWANWFDGEFRHRTFRFVNNNDLVPRVPPRALSYSHVGSFRYFDKSGGLHEDIGWWRLLLDRVQGSIEDFMALGADALKDHAMGDYLTHLERQRQA